MSANSGPDLSSLHLPDHASLYTRLRLALRLLKLANGDEGNPVYGQMLNVCLDSEVYASLAERLRDSPAWRRMQTEHPSLQREDLDLEALGRLPEGSLGHAFARYFRVNDISPFVTTLEVKSEADFISKRYRETHDLLHLVAGYDTDVMGEIELQAYVFGNLGIRTALLIVLFGSFGQVTRRRAGVDMSEYVRRVWTAYRRGRAAPCYLDFWFEDHWHAPVADLRAQLCGPPATVH